MNTITSSHETHTHVPAARRRRGVRFWTGRVLLGLFAVLLALAATGVIYQALATAIDRRAFAPPRWACSASLPCSRPTAATTLSLVRIMARSSLCRATHSAQ
jgi:hypothetical protein